MTQIFALTQRNGDQQGWLHLAREGTGAVWECLGMHANLGAMVDAALVKQARYPKSDFSFSFPRSGSEFMALPFDEQPSADEIKAVLPGYSLTFLLPIGHKDYAPGLWAHVWRDPRGGLSSPRRARFVEQVLVNELRAYFSFYTPQRISQGRAGAIELHARHDWSASKWLGEDVFPSRKPQPKSFLDARDAHEARRAKRNGKPIKPAEARP